MPFKNTLIFYKIAGIIGMNMNLQKSGGPGYE